MKIRHVLSTFLALAFPIAALTVIYDDECPPPTWDPNVPPTCRAPLKRPRFLRPPTTPHYPLPGDVNCRYYGTTGDEVGPETCSYLADRYSISLDKFFILNPELKEECNLEPNMDYCVTGFIEPHRAYDGLCGPPHRNASCAGMDAGQCCNSETWTCGDSEEDCAPGICYEGVCYGHEVYTTDGKCGQAHGDSKCAGKWGDCCSINGECGTGEDFCGEGVCYSGKCLGQSGSEL